MLRHSIERKRFGRALATTAVLAVVVSGVSVPAANAVPLNVGDLVKETTFTTPSMLHAGAVAANPTTGDVYVADRMSDKVFRFNKNGTLLGTRGGTGAGSGFFYDPMDIAINAAGEVYVVDNGNNRIQKFSSGLGFLTEWGSEGNAVGQFKSPKGIAISPATGNVIVADSNNHRVQRFGPNGGNATAWGSQGAEPGKLSFPADVAVTAGSTVLVADNGNDAVKTFTATGGYVSHFGKTGVEQGQLEGPGGLAIDKNGDIYVADLGNSRVQRFTDDGASKDIVAFPNGVTGVGLDTSLGRMFVTDGLNKTVHVYRKATSPGIVACPAGLGLVDSAYSSSMLTTGFPAANLSVWSGQLPPGMQLVNNVVKGTPTKVGVYPVTFKADNTVGSGATKACNITVTAAPAIAAGPKSWADAGKWYSSTLQATGFPAVSWGIASGALPSGLKLAGGKVYGTPNKPGTYQFALRANNNVAPAAVKVFTVKVYKASSKVTAKFSTKYPRVARTNIRATIKLTAPYTTGLSKTGKVRVYYGKKRVKTYSVGLSKKGVITVRLPKFKKTGKTRVTLKYSGNSQLKSAKRTITVRVR